MDSTILFESNLIDSTRYKKLKWGRYTLYFLLLIIGTSLIRPETQYQKHESLQERMGWDFQFIVGILLIIGVVAGLLYLYSIEFKVKGRLCIWSKGIEIENKRGTNFYRFDNIKKLKIERGATYHYEYQRDNHLHEADNWLFFEDKEGYQKYEFIIDSVEKNKEFEQMLKILRNQLVKYEYLSI